MCKVVVALNAFCEGGQKPYQQRHFDNISYWYTRRRIGASSVRPPGCTWVGVRQPRGRTVGRGMNDQLMMIGVSDECHSSDNPLDYLKTTEVIDCRKRGLTTLTTMRNKCMYIGAVGIANFP